MKKLFLLLCLPLLLIACAGSSNEPAANTEPPATEDPALALQAALQATMAAEQGDRGEQIAAWLAELETAESKWQTNPLQNYKIEVIYVNSNKAIIQIHTLTVKDGEIVDDTVRCSEQQQNCNFEQIDLANLTIPGLFTMARASLVNDEVNENSGGFQFHEEYGFPQFIGLKTTGGFPWYWQVESFEVLEN